MNGERVMAHFTYDEEKGVATIPSDVELESLLTPDEYRAVLCRYLPWAMVQNLPWIDRIGYGLCGPSDESEFTARGAGQR